MKVKKYQPTLSLKPTQFALGLLEVEFKVVEMKAMKAMKLEKMVRQTPVPVVISPWNEMCITDRHHFVFACWHAGVRRVHVEVVKDYSNSKLTYHGFWKKLAREKRAYLYDQFGEARGAPCTCRSTSAAWPTTRTAASRGWCARKAASRTRT